MHQSKLQSSTQIITLPAATYFITGTDTDVGKTICSKALLQAANEQGVSTLAYKPISAGCEQTDVGLRNGDALVLQRNSSLKVDYQAVNPIAYQQPIAPHIAANETEQPINLATVDQGLQYLQQQSPQYLFVEGAGGWHLPINHQQLFSEWVVAHKMPVILVVGLKLGCLNHALLTAQSIQQSDLNIAGWIANHLQPDMPYVAQNIGTLTEFIKAPLLAEIPYLDNIEQQNLTQYINVNFS